MRTALRIFLKDPALFVRALYLRWRFSGDPDGYALAAAKATGAPPEDIEALAWIGREYGHQRSLGLDEDDAAEAVADLAEFRFKERGGG